MYQKIFITGGTGFVGTNLINSLGSYYNSEIFVGDSSICDLRDWNAVKNYLKMIRPDCIIHLAATCGGIGANSKHPAIFMRNNLLMGMNLINSAVELDCVKKFINVSTICAYPKFTTVPFKEEDLWNGYPEETNAPYGIAKKTLVELLIAYNKEFGFNSVNLFPTNMYGPHDDFTLEDSHVIPAIILKVYNAMIKGEDKITVWGTGKVSREFLYVQDFCHAIKLAMVNEPGPYPINIGTGDETTIKVLVHIICDIMKYDGKLIFDNTKPDGQPRRCVDISRAKLVLGYKPQIKLREGLEKTIKQFLLKG